MQQNNNTTLSPDALKRLTAIHNGELAESIQKNTRYVITGFILGFTVGYVIATITGGSKFLFGIGGALVVGGAGYKIANAK